MKNTHLTSFFVLSIVFLFSCSNNKSEEIKKENMHKRNDLYQIDLSNTKVIWNGYKTNEKLKVVGFFNEFTCDREGKEFSSINELMKGLSFSIKSSSSSSGDPIRDFNLKEHFFKYLTNNFEINGVFGNPENDSIDVTFDVFGQKKGI